MSDTTNWSTLNYEEIETLKEFVRQSFQQLKGYNEDAPNPQLVAELEEILEIHVYTMQLWEQSFWEGSVQPQALQFLLVNKDMRLEGTNLTWRNTVKIPFEPVFTICKTAWLDFQNLYEVNKDKLTDEVCDVLWALNGKKFDFVPWLLFCVTGDANVLSIGSAVCRKGFFQMPREKFRDKLREKTRGEQIQS